MKSRRLISSHRTKYYLRYVLQIPSLYISSEKPHIFIFTTRRSGSTLLRDMIYSQKGFNYIDQPFCINQFNPYIKKFPDVFKYKLINFDERDEIIIKKYVNDLLVRNYVLRSQWAIWARQYHWAWERYVVKIVNANAAVDWFLNEYHDKAQLILLMRHPIAVALSIIKQKWEISLETYLSDNYFVSTYMNKEQTRYSYHILSEGSLLEKYVLEWCLENIVPRALLSQNKIPVYYYEDIISQPRKFSKMICEDLYLENPEEMVKVVSKPTRTATSSACDDILEHGPSSRVSKWMNRISTAEKLKIQKIFNVFGLIQYSAFDPFPRLLNK
ncbi:MAG: sulfotransferase [Candidatus Helarchaeota archaeon]